MKIAIVILMLALSSFACVGKKLELGQDDFKAQLLEFLPEEGSLERLVLIIPPTGGVNFLDKSYAEKLCEAGVGASIVKGWSEDDEYNLELEIHTRFYNRAQRAIALALEKYNDIELGILGTSVGGIHAAIAASSYEQIESAFLIVAGGNIDYIVANSSQDVLEDAKKKRLKRYGFRSLIEYQRGLKKILPFEPLEMPKPKGKKLGMIISTNDDVVPTLSQVKLANHWQPSYKSEFWLGHTPTVVAAWLFSSNEIVNFFK